MIWYNERINVPNTPTSHTITLKGIYTAPADSNQRHTIELIAEVTSDNDNYNLIIFEHSIRSLVHEEPTADDLSHRYHQKLIKAKNRLLTADYHKLKLLKRIV